MQQQWEESKPLVQWYKETMLPYLSQTIEQNSQLSPEYQKLFMAQIKAQTDGGLIDEQTQTAKTSLQTIRNDLLADAPVKQAQRDRTMAEIDASTPAMEEFYKEATQGLSEDSAMAGATADVGLQFKGAKEALDMDLGRMGISGDSGMSLKALGSSRLQEAGATAAARTKARTDTQNTNFSRLATATQMGKTNTSLTPATSGLAGTPTVGQSNTMSYGLGSDPTAVASSLSGQAANIAGRNQGSSTDSTTQDNSWMGSVAGLAAAGMMAYMS
ncbi:MAG TPA: hypothetical protein VNT26_14745 [Candidatus Sulfotelmatobacter sp.]|nr:hypothetical protein [Candidatus Sulfotelmatobacter sp.]